MNPNLRLEIEISDFKLFPISDFNFQIRNPNSQFAIRNSPKEVCTHE